MSKHKRQNVPKEQKVQNAAVSHVDNSQKKSMETYELSRENLLVTQAGLQTAIYSFSTSALFTAWRMLIDHFVQIPKRWVHFIVGLVTLFLLLSLLFSVTALFLTPNTRKKEITYEIIKNNNNRRVIRLKTSLSFFFVAIFIAIIGSFIFGFIYYFKPLIQMF